MAKEFMRNYRKVVPCCASCDHSVEAPMGEWFCGHGVSDNGDATGFSDYFKKLEELGRKIDPYGKCDDYE